MTADELHIKLTADTAQLTQQIDFAERDLKSFGTTSKRAADGAKASFDALKSTIVTLGVGAMLKEVVTAAGELEQNIGGSSAVFGNFAQSLQQSASQAYRTMGLSQSEYLATANKMGALFQGSGFSIAQSVDMTTSAMQRAADVASIMGVDVNSAMEAVSGAAKGNFTMMDNLGVAINDTTLQIYAQEKGLGKLETTQQKVNAAMQMFLEKSDYAAGNYAKENETFAGSLQTFRAELQNAAAEVGTELLPVATQGIQILSTVLKEAAPVITDIVRGFGTLAQGMQLLENPAVRSIAYIVAVSSAFNKLKLAVGGPLSALILFGTVLSWIVGKFGETEEKASDVIGSSMEGAALATDDATKSAGELEEKYKDVEETVKSMLAPFDEITKLSGSSSSVGSKLVSAEDVSNAANLSDELSKLDKAYDLEVNVPDVEIPEIGLPEIDWDVIKTNLEKWVDETDWKALFLDIGNAFVETYSIALDIIDGIFGTHFSEWYNKTVDLSFDIGKKIYAALNPDDEGIAALEKYEAEHGESAWTTFYNKYKSGENPYKAFNEVYNTQELKDGFFAVDYRLATGYVDQFKGLGKTQLRNALGYEQVEGLNDFRDNMKEFLEPGSGLRKNELERPEIKAQDTKDGTPAEYVNPEDPLGLAGYNGKWTKFVFDTSAMESESATDKAAKRFIGSKSNLAEQPATATDILNIFRNSGFVGPRNNPIQIYTTVELDGEKLGENQVNYQNNQIDVTNGR